MQPASLALGRLLARLGENMSTIPQNQELIDIQSVIYSRAANPELSITGELLFPVVYCYDLEFTHQRSPFQGRPRAR